MKIRYAHTNLIAVDWKRLSAFYQNVFSCVPVPPERHYRGTDLERGTGVTGSELHGIHLRLPGYGDDGPTLEIYTYSKMLQSETPAVNRPGLGHLAFEVDNVGDMREKTLAAGGKAVGDIVTLTTAIGSRVIWCYVTDPELNIIELQCWG